MKGNIHLAEREGGEDRFESRVQFLEDREEKLGENDRLAVELAEDILGKVSERWLFGGGGTLVVGLLVFLGGGNFGVCLVDESSEALDLSDGRGCCRLLLLLRGARWQIGDDAVCGLGLSANRARLRSEMGNISQIFEKLTQCVGVLLHAGGEFGHECLDAHGLALNDGVVYGHRAGGDERRKSSEERDEDLHLVGCVARVVGYRALSR